MKNVFNIQVQRADNGFVAICQWPDEPKLKTKKVVATSDEDVKSIVKDFADHMFDKAPEKTPEVPPTPSKPT